MQVTDTVRVVRTAGLLRTALFATVLSVQPPRADDDGTNGEPTITIAYLDSARVSLLGTPRWAEAFHRVPTVRHVSHPDVQTGAEEYCYTEVLSSDGGPVHLQGLNMDAEDGPVAEAADAPSTIGTIVYINHGNGLEVFHGGENIFRVHHKDEDHDFTDLFSAKVYVDAQPKPEETLKPVQPEVSADEIAGHIFEQVSNGEDVTVPDGANLGTFIKVSSDAMHALKRSNDTLVRALDDVHKRLQPTSVPDGKPTAADLDAIAEMQKAADATGSAQLASATPEAAPARTVEIGEYPPEENISEPFSVKIDGVEVERFVTREAAQEYIDKWAGNPPQSPAEAVAAEQQQQDEVAAQQ